MFRLTYQADPPLLTFHICSVQADLSRMTCSGWTFLPGCWHAQAELSKLTCPGWPVHADLSHLSCPIWRVQSDLSRLPYPGWPFPVELSWLTISGCLSRLTCLVWQARLTCLCWIALSDLSSFIFQADLYRLVPSVLSRLAYLVWPVQADLSLLSCPCYFVPAAQSLLFCPLLPFLAVLFCPVILSSLFCPGCPILAVLSWLSYLSCFIQFIVQNLNNLTLSSVKLATIQLFHELLEFRLYLSANAQ